MEAQADEKSLSAKGSNLGDPDMFPRVGEKYQIKIPPLIPQSEYLFQKKPCEPESTASNNSESPAELPIPVVWIQRGVKMEDACHLTDSTSFKKKNLGECGDSYGYGKLKFKGNSLVPGSSSDTWNAIEEASFVLGLYIFGKSLVQVKRFVGNKNMGDILSFYYGKFYRTDSYQRWSKCRKMRSTKCIYRRKIFTGSTQQKLLSRLLPNISNECCDNLYKVSKAFTERKMRLEDYVLSLKASVGLSALIEAVGVGKGNDLTGMNAETLKSTQMLHVRPKIPVGKACSMLTREEIITILTGNFRRSKDQSSDLFWEAVWPRLLARGWHSEQPGCRDYALASNNSLVFLVPGVKKFSKKLVKGNHYFNSVRGVLGEVASNPELIELDSDASNDSTNNEEYEWTKETNLDWESSPDQVSSLDQQRHCYLKPRIPKYSRDVRKLTVVDTSPAIKMTKKISKLRSSPLGVLEACSSENDLDNEETSEEKTIEPDSVKTMYSFLKKIEFPKVTKCSIVKNNPSRVHLPVSGIVSANLSIAFKDRKMDILYSKKTKATKCQSNWRLIPDNRNVQSPVPKRRRKLTACNRRNSNASASDISVPPSIKPVNVSFHHNNLKCSKTFLLQNLALENKMVADLPSMKKKTSQDPVSNDSLIISREAVPDTDSAATKEQSKKSQPQAMVDLNSPVSHKDEGNESSIRDMSEPQQNNIRNESDDHSARTISQPVEMNGRRQSTRNRPLTTKALEAFAFGYLDKKEKRKNRDHSFGSPMSRPPRHPCYKVMNEFTDSNRLNFQKDDRAHSISNEG